jgi:hypothetical protein
MVESLLHQLSQELELPLSPKDEKGMFHLEINPELKIAIKALDTGALLFTKLKSCPKEKREELFTLLMRANLLGIGTGGGVIALDEEEKFLTLSFVLPYDVNFKAFKETVEDFTNFVDYWRGELLKHEQSATQTLL